MTKYQEKIVNIQTGEVILRDYTADEIAAFEASKAEGEALVAERLEAQSKVEADRASALAKLADLGLTLDEVKAVVGA